MDVIFRIGVVPTTCSGCFNFECIMIVQSPPADDQVYYSDPSIDLEEYISSDLDLLFAGQTGAITTTPWYLGQVSLIYSSVTD